MSASPDWDFWRQMPETELWKCVALSCGIEARYKTDFRLHIDALDAKFEQSSVNESHFGTATSEYSAEQYRRYLDRYDITLAHLKAGRIRTSSNVPAIPSETLVSIPAFARFALSKKWVIPPELEEMAAGAPTKMETPQIDEAPELTNLKPKPWTLERRKKLRDNHKALKSGGCNSPTKDLAKANGVSEQRIRALLAKDKPQPAVGDQSSLNPSRLSFTKMR